MLDLKAIQYSALGETPSGQKTFKAKVVIGAELNTFFPELERTDFRPREVLEKRIHHEIYGDMDWTCSKLKTISAMLTELKKTFYGDNATLRYVSDLVENVRTELDEFTLESMRESKKRNETIQAD